MGRGYWIALALALVLVLGANDTVEAQPLADAAAKRCKAVKKKQRGKVVRKRVCGQKKARKPARRMAPGRPAVTDFPAQQQASPQGNGGGNNSQNGNGGGQGNGGPQPAPTATPTPTPTPTATPTPTPDPAPEDPGTPNEACDGLDPAVCLLPWPNDLFTVAADTPTGRRLNLALTSMPRNLAGKPIDPIEFNRYDGFSTGTPIITKVPGLDNQEAFQATGLVPENDMARAFDPDQPLVVLDADTGERQLVWAELDQHSETVDDADRVLIVRPGKNFTEGHRIIVALRNLRDRDGKTLEPNESFAAYRDGTATDDRAPHMEWIFETLGRAGVAREDLYLAWDFTVASEDDRAGRMLRMRDEAFAALGDTDLSDLKVEGEAPTFTVDEPTEEADPRVARTVTGTFELPCFLNTPGCVEGSRFAFLGPQARDFTAIPGNTMQATFTCRIPRKAVESGEPARVSLYGHGLLGGQGEVGAGNVSDMVGEHNVMMCATDWYGMATSDVPTVATILLDVSNFPALPDRVQQGMLAQLFLARLMVHPDGFASDPAFQQEGKPVIDTRRAFYDGNSQGGIIGGAVMAVAPDIERGVLGVPGMNYSTLLNRSVDFETDPEHPCPAPPEEVASDLAGWLADPEMDPEFALELLNVSYACPLYLSYPTVIERQLIFSLMQQHWDRGEANGYAPHMTDDPYANTPAHQVLLHPALGDHQVAQVAAEVMARTIGAAVRSPAVDPGRSHDVAPQYGIAKITAWPFAGSVYELWDSGPGRNPVAPLGNVPPYEGEDPHGRPRATPAARAQKSDFLRIGGVATDQCAGAPCHSFNWSR